MKQTVDMTSLYQLTNKEGTIKTEGLYCNDGDVIKLTGSLRCYRNEQLK
jgi:hypothetical protein